MSDNDILRYKDHSISDLVGYICGLRALVKAQHKAINVLKAGGKLSRQDKNELTDLGWSYKESGWINWIK